MLTPISEGDDGDLVKGREDIRRMSGPMLEPLADISVTTTCKPNSTVTDAKSCPLLKKSEAGDRGNYVSTKLKINGSVPSVKKLDGKDATTTTPTTIIETFDYADTAAAALTFAKSLLQGTSALHAPSDNDGRRAFASITDLAPVAEVCLEITEIIQAATPRTSDSRRPMGDGALCKAIMLAIKAVEANHTLVERGMTLCLRALLNNPSKALAKRARHGVRCLVETTGMAGHAAFKLAAAYFADAGGGNAEGVQNFLEEWHRLSDAKLERIPLPLQEWLQALQQHADHDGAPDKVKSSVRDESKGVATWKSKPHPAHASRDVDHINAVTWNANSFFKRLRTKGFAELLKDHPDLDIIHLTELRSALRHRHYSRLNTGIIIPFRYRYGIKRSIESITVLNRY